jgi:hypothetical protein
MRTLPRLHINAARTPPVVRLQCTLNTNLNTSCVVLGFPWKWQRILRIGIANPNINTILPSTTRTLFD